MGLDVYLYQFKDSDTDAILELSRFSEGLCALYGATPSPTNWEEYRAKLAAKARDLGLPENIADNESFGGNPVCFRPEKHPDSSLAVGEWDTLFSYTNAVLLRFINRDIYYVIPEAKGDPQFIRPDWSAAKKRMIELLDEFQKLDLKCLAEFGDPEREFKDHIENIMVIIETFDFVLLQTNPKQFLLYWSA